MTLGPLPPVPSTLKIVLSGFVDAHLVDKWENVLHFSYTGSAPTGVTCGAIALAIGNAWETHMAPLAPSPTALSSVTVTDLTSDSAGEGSDSTGWAGTRGDDSIPANAAVLVSYPLTTRYRGGHPRTYLLCGGNADLDGAAAWSDALVAAVAAGWEAFLAAVKALAISGTALNQMVAIRYYGKFLPNEGPPRYRLTIPVVLPITISTLVVQKEISSQRGRVGRRKR